MEYAIPSEKGFSEERLDSLSMFLEEASSSALMILVDGKIIYEWGETDQKLIVHSIRKCLLNSLYGIYVSNGTIDTTWTLEELGIDDIEPSLSNKEKSATVGDLLKSRSGVYHPAAATSQGMRSKRPERGSHKPNEAYYYNNWDFNTLGHILEVKTGESVYTLFHEHIATPLGMNYNSNYVSIKDPTESLDIPEVDGFYQYETAKSQFPAYHFRLSAKDLARYGLLYLNNGIWEGNQIIPKEWIDVSTKAYSIINPTYGIGYGLLWRILTKTEKRKTKSFFHTGVGIHMLGIYPGSNLVLVHRVNTEKDYDFNEGDFYKMISLVWGAQIQNE